MTEIEIERQLSSGNQLGVRKDADDDAYLGWVLLRKRMPVSVTPFDPHDQKSLYEKWLEQSEDMIRNPYHILVIEVKKVAHYGEDYETEEDMRNKENFYVSSLAEVENVFARYGKSVFDVKHRSEIDAP